MSITEKLAQALRDVLDPAAKAERDGRKFDSYVLRHPETYKRIAREALAEYDATPAGGVTADAVEVANFIAMHDKFMEVLNDMDDETFDRQLRQFRELRYGLSADALDEAEAVQHAINGYAEFFKAAPDMPCFGDNREAMQAALAAAFPALVQQVEDMKESVHQWRRQYNMEFERCDALSAANARLSAIAKEATCMGLAAIATYGRRDENGLCGLSKKHWAELVVLQDATKGEK